MEMTMKNTKQEILEALKEANERISKLNNACLTKPDDDGLCIKNAEEDIKSGIFSDEINKKYENVMNAVKIQEDRLCDLYDIDSLLLNMASASDAHKRFMATLEENKKATLAEIETSVKEARTKAEEEKAALKKEREREEEEFLYQRNRQRAIENDSYEDKKENRMKELNEREESIQARENAVMEAEADIEKLKEENAVLMAEKDSAYDLGFEEGRKKAGKEYGYEKAAISKEAEFEKRLYESKIENLMQQIKEKDDRIAAIELQLAQAYNNVKDVAVATAKSNTALSGGTQTVAPTK